MRLRRPWTRRSIRANRIPRRTGPRGTGHWSWVDGDFDCRRNRSGKWPAVPERGRAYGFGSEVSLLGRFGWFAENSGKHVHPPRELRPSIRGLFDLHGNLFEWSHDWWGDYGVDAITDPLGAKEGSSRVTRGGGWSLDAAVCRSAIRNTLAPTIRTSDNGFRLALSLSGVTPEAAPARERSHRAQARRERLRSSDRRCRSRMAERFCRRIVRHPFFVLDESLPPGIHSRSVETDYG